MYLFNIIYICTLLIYLYYIYKNLYSSNDILKKLPEDYFLNIINKSKPIFDFSSVNLDLLLIDINTLRDKIKIEKNNTIVIRNSIELINTQINIQETDISNLHKQIDDLRYSTLTTA